MRVGDEDDADLSELYASFQQPAQRAVTRVNQVQRPIDDQQIRRLCLVRDWNGAYARPEGNEACAGLCGGGARRLCTGIPCVPKHRGADECNTAERGDGFTRSHAALPRVGITSKRYREYHGCFECNRQVLGSHTASTTPRVLQTSELAQTRASAHV